MRRRVCTRRSTWSKCELWGGGDGGGTRLDCIIGLEAGGSADARSRGSAERRAVKCLRRVDLLNMCTLKWTQEKTGEEMERKRSHTRGTKQQYQYCVYVYVCTWTFYVLYSPLVVTSWVEGRGQRARRVSSLSAWRRAGGSVSNRVQRKTRRSAASPALLPLGGSLSVESSHTPASSQTISSTRTHDIELHPLINWSLVTHTFDYYYEYVNFKYITFTIQYECNVYLFEVRSEDPFLSFEWTRDF